MPSAYREVYLPLELRPAAHARLAAPSLAIPLRARLSVSRSAARGRRARRESDPSPRAQAPESPYFPRFEAELGEMRENGPRPDSPLRVVSACDNNDPQLTN